MAKEKVDYQTYLASREWGVLREQVRARSRNQCEHCFSAPQQAVHHLTYERIGHEELRDLMAVCNPCHEFLSGKADKNPQDEFIVVTPVFMARYWERLGWETGEHFILPFAKGKGVEMAICRGVGCIWCGYADPDWPIFLHGLIQK